MAGRFLNNLARWLIMGRKRKKTPHVVRQPPTENNNKIRRGLFPALLILEYLLTACGTWWVDAHFGLSVGWNRFITIIVPIIITFFGLELSANTPKTSSQRLYWRWLFVGALGLYSGFGWAEQGKKERSADVTVSQFNNFSNRVESIILSNIADTNIPLERRQSLQALLISAQPVSANYDFKSWQRAYSNKLMQASLAQEKTKREADNAFLEIWRSQMPIFINCLKHFESILRAVAANEKQISGNFKEVPQTVESASADLGKIQLGGTNGPVFSVRIAHNGMFRAEHILFIESAAGTLSIMQEGNFIQTFLQSSRGSLMTNLPINNYLDGVDEAMRDLIAVQTNLGSSEAKQSTDRF